MIYLKTDYDYGLSPYESILKYKTNKINNKESITLGFFGDSSCGNGIDASYFGDNAANLSLVKNYNLTGSLEMIKKARSIHKDLDTVIIMHSFDTFSIDTNWVHHIKNVNELEQRTLLNNFMKKLKIFRPKLKYAFKKLDFSNLFKISTPIENDFLKQGEKSTSIQLSRVDTISNVNKRCILDIIKYCNINNINYFFLLGPSTKVNPDYNKLDELINFFYKHTENFSPINYTIDINNIGDSPYHTHPFFKDQSTIFYKKILMRHFDK